MLIAIVAVTSTDVRALYDCDAIPDLGDRVRASSLVLLGEVSELRWAPEFLAQLEEYDPQAAADFRAHPPGRSGHGGTVVATLVVQEALKGSANGSVEFRSMHTILDLGCDFPFLERGRHAIVFLASGENGLELVGAAHGLIWVKDGKTNELQAVRAEIRRQRAG